MFFAFWTWTGADLWVEGEALLRQLRKQSEEKNWEDGWYFLLLFFLLPTLNVNEMKAVNQLIFKSSSNYVLMQCSVKMVVLNCRFLDFKWWCFMAAPEYDALEQPLKIICSPNSEYLYLASIHIGEFLFFRDWEGGLLPVDTEGDSQGNCETWGCPQKSEKGGSGCRIVEQEVEELMKFCTNHQFCTLIDLSAACINSLPTEFIRTSALSVYVDDQYFGTATPKSQPLSSIRHEICEWWDWLGWNKKAKIWDFALLYNQISYPTN